MSDLHVVRTVVVASFRGPKTRAALFFLFLFWSSEDTGAVTNAMIYLLDAPMPGNREREGRQTKAISPCLLSSGLQRGRYGNKHWLMVLPLAVPAQALCGEPQL